MPRGAVLLQQARSADRTGKPKAYKIALDQHWLCLVSEGINFSSVADFDLVVAETYATTFDAVYLFDFRLERVHRLQTTRIAI